MLGLSRHVVVRHFVGRVGPIWELRKLLGSRHWLDSVGMRDRQTT